MRASEVIEMAKTALCPKCGCPPRSVRGGAWVSMRLEGDRYGNLSFGPAHVIRMENDRFEFACGGGHVWDVKEGT